MSMKKQDPYINEFGESLRINTISQYLKKEFGNKVIKLSIDGGFTCPNRNGEKGTGGCTFCGNGGGSDFASDIYTQLQLYSTKWPNALHLAYFQNHTNTYAPVSILKEKYYQALKYPEIKGIVIATRPDCLEKEVLNLLSEINSKHFMWIELGLQTSNEHTAYKINRCYPNSIYEKKIKELNNLGIKVVTHLILGLPGETKEDMMNSAKFVAKNNSWGIKLHLLNIIKGSTMSKEYPNYSSFNSIEEYITTVCDIIEILPKDMVVHRLTADVDRKNLISPSWSYKKRTILNGIYSELKKRDSFQGAKYL